MNFHGYTPKPGVKLRPFFTTPVTAGMPKQIDQVVEWLNIDDYFRSSVDSVYYIRVFGDSMQDVGIHDGDLLVVRQTVAARTGDIVIAEVSPGEFTIKRLSKKSSGLYLVPANNSYAARKVEPLDYFAVWGVVTYIIHKV